MSISKSDIKIGAKVYSSIRQEPWTINSRDSEVVELVRSGQRKRILEKSMLYGYTLVGSEADIKHRKDCEYHKYPVWKNL